MKKGEDPHEAKSYRPVSLTSCVAKVMGRLVRMRLQHVVEKRDYCDMSRLGSGGVGRRKNN